MFTFSVLAMLPFTNGVFSKVCNRFYNKLMVNSVGSSLVGGTFMGLGMTISGSVVFTLLQFYLAFYKPEVIIVVFFKFEWFKFCMIEGVVFDICCLYLHLL